MSLLQNSNAISAGGYTVDNSLRFRASASAYLNRTPASAGDTQKWTWSAWIKLGKLSTFSGLFGALNGTDRMYIGYGSSAKWQIYGTNAGTDYIEAYSTGLYRDPSAWYHLVIAVDTTQATAANRLKMYVNGNQETVSFTTNMTLNANTSINKAIATAVGETSVGNDPFDGYLAEVNFIDGSQKAASDFGETDTTTGVWKPKAYTGSYGTNGFYLKFSDIATTSGSNAGLGKDFANTNYWTTNNISVTSGTTYDAMIDSPTNATSGTRPVGNYPVLNPLGGQGNGTYSDGNLAYINGTSATWKSGVGSLGVSSGKYYFEYTITSVSSSNYFYLGVAGSTYNGFASYLGRTSDSWAFQWNGASSNKMNNDTTTTVNTAGSISVNDVIQVAIDLGTGSIWWGRNNTWVQGDPSAGTGASYTNLSGTILPGFAIYSNGGDKIAANFGQRPFTYTPPTGFQALCTTNLPTPTILQGNKYMDATLYTGTGSSQSISGVNFQPDFVWVKGRSGATDHALYDAVRGVQKQLESNTTTDETTETTGLTAFNSNGFTVGALAQLNTSTATYVGWSWKETATSGFDIVTYTGNGSNRTISHSLGVAPKMIIVKARTTASTDQGWAVYHASNTTAPETDYLLLNSTAATADLDTVWNDTAPTSSVFSVGTNALVNTNNDTYVAYCFAEISGFSKFTSYTGNGSTDGPFVFCNFRPKFVMYKRTDSSTSGWWNILDTTRNTYNVATSILYADLSQAEDTADRLDFLSNGFKIRSTNASLNASGGTYIVAAFAENPYKVALAR